MSSRFFLLYIAFAFVSCGNDGKVLDTPTTGTARIVSDECFYPVIDAELTAFHGLYKYASIEPRYLPEQEALKVFVSDSDSVRLMVTTRLLSADETKFFESKKIFPRVTRVAVDAIAFIIHPSNPDSNLSYPQLEALFQGRTPLWKDLFPASGAGKLSVVFDHEASSTARMIKEKFLRERTFPDYCFALDSNTSVIRYVSEHKGAVGIIGVSWISDGDDPVTAGFLDKIKVVSISPPDTSKFAGEYFPPFQAYMVNREYPLCRDIYLISREPRTGLGTGFASFVAGDSGQRIILKSALLPATMPVRIIGIKEP